MRRLACPTSTYGLAYSPDTRYLFSVGESNSTISVWSLQAGEIVEEIEMPITNQGGCTEILSIVFCLPNKLAILTKYQYYCLLIRNWPATSETTSTHFSSSRFRPDLQLVLNQSSILLSFTGSSFTVLNPSTNQRFGSGHHIRGNGPPFDISNDGTLVAWSTGYEIQISGFSDPRTFQVDQQPKVSLSHNDFGIRFLRFHPFEQKIAASYTGTIRVFDAISGLPINRVSYFEGEAVTFTYTPDGSKLLLLTDEGILHIWNTSTYEEIATYDFDVQSAKCLTVSPDSLTCAIGGGFLEIVLVDLV